MRFVFCSISLLVLLTFVSAVIAQPDSPFVSDEHTIALYHADDGNGTTLTDASGNGYDLQLSQPAGWTENGQFDGAADFSTHGSKATSNYTVGNGLTELTLEAWINPDHFIGDNIMPIVSRYEWYQRAAFYLVVYQNGALLGGVYNSYQSYPHVISEEGLLETGRWQHVAMTWSAGDELILWIDGVEVASDECNGGAVMNSPDRLTVGYHWNNNWYPDDYFHGDIDEVRISDVVRYFPGEEYPVDEYTEALWHFNEGNGSTAYDASGNGHHLTLSDGASWTDLGWCHSAADMTDADAKLSSNHLIGNGWDELTLEAYIYPTLINGPYHPIICRCDWHNVTDPSFYFYLIADGSLYAGVYLNSPGSTYSSILTEPGIIEVNPEHWYHVAMTWSSGEPVRIFVDGELIATSPRNPEGVVRTGNDHLTVGCNFEHWYGWKYFNGYMDEARISNSVRYTPFEPPIIVPPAPIDFGEVEFRRTATQTVQIGNIGGAALEIESVTVTDEAFEIIDYPEIVEPDCSGNIVISFTPEEVREYPESMIIESNDEGSPHYVPVSGIGIWVTPQTLLARLILEVNALRDAGSINRGQENGLVVKLEHPIDRLNRGQIRPAVNQINAFINHVNDLIEEGVLTEEEGGPLAVEAQFIIDLINEFGVDGQNASQMATPIPTEYFLSECYPNPFNSMTTISFGLPEASRVNLKVYDTFGRVVQNLIGGNYSSGYHLITWEANEVSVGVYLIRLATGEKSFVRKVTLIH